MPGLFEREKEGHGIERLLPTHSLPLKLDKSLTPHYILILGLQKYVLLMKWESPLNFNNIKNRVSIQMQHFLLTVVTVTRQHFLLMEITVTINTYTESPVSIISDSKQSVSILIQVSLKSRHQDRI